MNETNSTQPEPNMAASDQSIEAGVFIWSTIQLSVIFIAVLYLLRGFTDRKATSYFIQAVVFSAWYMSFSIIVFIPLDIYLNQKYTDIDQAQGADKREDALLLDWWLISYWSSYILNWLVIPILQGYVIAGEFNIFERIYRSIVFNVPFYLMYFFSFIILLLMLVFIDNKRDDDENILDSQGILAVVIALSLSFGFFLLCCLLGYALVKIPLSFWEEADLSKKMQRLHFDISSYEDQILVQQNEVQKLVNILNAIEVESEVELYKRIMQNDVQTFTLDMQQYDFTMRSGSFLDADHKLHNQFIKPGQEADYTTLVNLNVKLKNEMTNLKRLFSFKSEKIKSAIIAGDILSQRAKITSWEQQIISPYFEPQNQYSLFGQFMLKFQFYWFVKNYREKSMKGASILCSLLSLFVIIMEVMFFFNGFKDTWIHQFFIDQDERSYFTQSLIYVIPFGYILYATNFGLFNFDLIDFLTLHWNQNTDPYCLMYSCINTWRLGIPIAYNFLQIIDVQSCSFLKVMGPVQQIPFIGTGINEWVFPICLCLMVLMTMFDVYSWVLRCFGSKKVYNPGSSNTEEKIEEGVFIVEKFRKDKHMQSASVQIENSYSQLSGGFSEEQKLKI